MRSIGPQNLITSLLKGDLNSLSELVSSGKSGSFFYYTADGRFTLKTVKRDEFKFLKHILRHYHEHLINHPQSLIIKFFGCHKIRFAKSSKEDDIYFVIMENIFSTRREIHERYDLKGSTYKRFTKEK